MLGIFKKCLISLSVIFGGFGINLGSSVIDVSNSTQNVFKAQIKQVNDSSSSSSLCQVGDVIKIGNDSYQVLELNTSSTSSSSVYSFKNSASFVYISYWVGSSFNSSNYWNLSFSLSDDIILFGTNRYYTSSSVNSFYVNSSVLSLLKSPSSSGNYEVPLLLSFNQDYTFKFDSGGNGSARILVLSYLKPLNLVTDSIDIIVSGLTEFGKGLGTGISDIVTAMMYTGEGASKALSPFFVVVLVFASIALCVSLTTLLFNWLRNFGGGR